MSTDVNAVAMLLALVKENPDLIGQMQSAENPAALVAELEKVQAEETAKIARAKELGKIARRINKGQDAEKVLADMTKFATSVKKTFTVKEVTPITSRWHVTIDTPEGKVTVMLHADTPAK